MTTFKPARRENVPLLVGLDGTTSTGKTYSALLLASGIAEAIGAKQGREGRIFFIDTERGRGLHYADEFSFMHGEVRPPFTPDAYGSAIDQAEQAGADVIVIDSFSHEWEGEGGVKDWAERLEAGEPKPGIPNPESWKRDQWIRQPVKSPQNWTDPKLAHRRLVNKMLAARAHIIVCLRSQEKMRVENVPELDNNGDPVLLRNGKPKSKMVITPAADLPVMERWAPITEKAFPFEITTSFLLTPDAPGVPKPRKLTSAHRDLVPLDRPLSKAVGVALANWSMGAKQADPAESALAEIAAATTLDQLRDLWRRHNRAAWWSRVDAAFNERRAALTPADPAPADPTPPNDGGYDGV